MWKASVYLNCAFVTITAENEDDPTKRVSVKWNGVLTDSGTEINKSKTNFMITLEEIVK